MSAEHVEINPADSTSCPAGWREASVSSVADVRFSNVDKKAESGEQPVRLCNYTDVYENDYITADMEFMQATATRTEIDRFGLDVGDVIVTKDSETPDDIGVPTVVDTAAPNLVCGYHLAMMRPDQEQVDPTFLAKQLGNWRLARYFGRQANGSTRYGLSTAAIQGAALWLPSLDQQKQISRILRKLDAAIAKTEAVIAKLRSIRAGLLHDLLTCGLDANGQLRDPLRHPEQFKPSPLGPIPKEWNVVPVEAVGEVRLGRQRSPAHETGQYPMPYLRVANVFDGYIDYSDVLVMNFDPREQDVYGLRPGDILLNEGQSLELVGRSAIYDGPPGRYCFQNTLVRFRCNRDSIPAYCRAVFKLWLDIGRFTTIAKQTTSVAHLGADRFAKMAFPLPSAEEQQRIAEALAQAERRAESEMQHADKLRLLKAGLLADLLNGYVRVPTGLVKGL